jgi:hybrid cluster-associated redox disulfide protein
MIIDKNTSIKEVVKKYPETIAVFERYGLGCVGCPAALFENIQQGADVHGIEINGLIDSLNSIIGKDK